MRTKVTVKQVRIPVAALNAQILKAKFADFDDYLDAAGAAVYTAAGAISPNVAFALIDVSVPRQAMTLADGTIAGEQILVKLRDRVTVAAVDATEDTLTIDNHQMATVDGPFWIASSTNQIPTGLHAGTPYYVIDESDYQIKLAVSPAAAAAGTAVNLTSVGAGTITLIKVTDITSVVFGTDTMTAVGHGYVTGDGPFSMISDQTVPAPLVKGTRYYVIRVTDDTFKLAADSNDALAGTPINLTSNGTGNVQLHEEDFKTIAAANGSARITPTNLSGGTHVDLGDEGDRARLVWSGTAWAVKGTGIATSGGELTSVAHGLVTGNGPFYIAATVTIPTGLAALTEYWIIRLTNDKFLLANSEANALGGIAVNVTGAGAGTITLSRLIPIDVVEDVASIQSFLDLGAETVNCDTVVRNAVAGVVGDDTILSFVADGAGAGTLDEGAFPVLVFHYQTGVTTVTNFETAVTGGARLEVQTPGTGANLLVVVDDAFPATNLAGGRNQVDLFTATAHVIPDEATVRIEAQPAGVIPTGLLGATTYYAIVGGDPDTFELATSQPNAAANTEINITSEGTLPLRLYQLAYKTITAVDPAPVS